MGISFFRFWSDKRIEKLQNISLYYNEGQKDPNSEKLTFQIENEEQKNSISCSSIVLMEELKIIILKNQLGLMNAYQIREIIMNKLKQLIAQDKRNFMFEQPNCSQNNQIIIFQYIIKAILALNDINKQNKQIKIYFGWKKLGTKKEVCKIVQMMKNQHSSLF